MPKRQKAKVRPTSSTAINKQPSPAKLARIERQNAQEANNKELKLMEAPTPWAKAKGQRGAARITTGKTYANWRKANASSIGENKTASVSNTLF